LERIRKVSTFASAFETESTTAKALSSFKNEMHEFFERLNNIQPKQG
jgi:hypothetical protein